MDIFTDYVNGLKHEEKVDSGKLLVFNREFSQELTNKRMVRALDYSTFYPELLAVAYDRNSELPLSSEGIVNVWNTKFKTPPEFVFCLFLSYLKLLGHSVLVLSENTGSILMKVRN